MSSHINATHRVKLGFCDVQMAVQAAAFTPLSDDGEVGLSHIAHEQQDVDVAGLPEDYKNGNSVRNEKIDGTVMIESYTCLTNTGSF